MDCRGYGRRQNVLIIFAFVVAIVLLRLPTLWIPVLDVDEAIFANFANRLLDGGIPYIDMLDNKPMGIFYLFSAVFALFGHGNMIAVHIVTMLIVAATCYFIYKICLFFATSRVGIIAALIYAVYTTTYIPKFIATEIEIVMMLPLTAGIYLYLLGEGRALNRWFLLSGVLSGLAVIFKYQAGINLIVVGIYWLWQFRRSKENITRHITRVFIFTIGYLVAPTLMLLHLYAIGSWSEFVASTLSASMSYISAGMGSIHMIRQFLLKGGTLMLYSHLLWIAAVWMSLHLVKPANVIARKDWRDRSIYLILAWFAMTWLSVITGGRFYGHYFVQLIAPAAILAAIKIDKWCANRSTQQVIIISIVASILASAPQRYIIDKYYHLAGEDNPKSYRPIAEYIKAHTSPDDFVYAWGFAPCIYLFSERHSSSRFPYSDQLVGRVTGLKNTPQNPIDTSSFVNPKSWDIFWADIKKHPPKYIIDTAMPNMHGYAVYPIEKQKALMDYIRSNYVYETSVNSAPIWRLKTY